MKISKGYLIILYTKEEKSNNHKRCNNHNYDPIGYKRLVINELKIKKREITVEFIIL